MVALVRNNGVLWVTADDALYARHAGPETVQVDLLGAERMLQRLRWAVTVIDEWPVDEGVRVVRAAAEQECPVVVIVGEEDLVIARGALWSGARAVVARTATIMALGAVIDLVEAGYCVLPFLAGKSSVDGQSSRFSLSVRETEIMHLLCRGRTNKQISTALCLAETTVRNHLSRVFVKLGVECRTAAMAVFLGTI